MSGFDKNGGAAFPTVTRTEKGQNFGNAHHDYEVTISAQDGMSLRDYFAAQALAGFTATEGDTYDEQGTAKVASRCYRIADAMLVARKTPKPEPTIQDSLDDPIDLG